jgi:hypothetical protein
MFPNPGRTLGKTPMNVESQGLVMRERFAPYVENVRFSKNGVQLATRHVVGTNTNLHPKRPGAAEEFRARDAANAAWIDHAFAAARQEDSKAVVLAWQANVHMKRGVYGTNMATLKDVVDQDAGPAPDKEELQPVLYHQLPPDLHLEVIHYFNVAGVLDLKVGPQ